MPSKFPISFNVLCVFNRNKTETFQSQLAFSNLDESLKTSFAKLVWKMEYSYGFKPIDIQCAIL